MCYWCVDCGIGEGGVCDFLGWSVISEGGACDW